MLKMTSRLVVAAAVALLALPAAAGSWPNYRVKPSGKSFTTEEKEKFSLFSRATEAARSTLPSIDGFEYVGGDTGWQLSQHKYVLAGGRFAHSEDCDHAIRTAKAPTLEEVDRARRSSPGA